MRRGLCDFVFERAEMRPDSPALSYRDETVSYSDLGARVRGFAAVLSGLGVERGDRIGIYLEKRIESVIAIFGSSAAGAAFVPVNPVLKARQVAHILRDSGARVLVTSGDRLRTLDEYLGDLNELQRIILVDGDGEEDPSRVAWPLAHADEAPPVPYMDADLGAILYTSGSTGLPKGVALTHRNLVAGAESVNAYLPNAEDDVILAILPLSFDAGLSQLTTGLESGAHVVLANYLLPRDVVRLCARHAVTALTCVPPLWIQLADQDWGSAGASLRYFANTGGRMPRVTLDRLRGIFADADPYLMYGLTEAFRSTYLDPAEVDRRPDSIGRAIPNAEILVLRPDGTECDVDEAGELVHRGALVALGYWNDPERTAERFRPFDCGRGAWAPTEIAVWSGDVVRRDHEGFLYFVGRADDMIKTSGYRVSPTEIEEASLATGLVQDAVALGVEDSALGQRILLVVTPRSEGFDMRALQAALRKELPSFMIPSHIRVRERIPRGPNGKYDRVALRDEIQELV